jgi:hypothetical protein
VFLRTAGAGGARSSIKDAPAPKPLMTRVEVATPLASAAEVVAMLAFGLLWF